MMYKVTDRQFYDYAYNLDKALLASENPQRLLPSLIMLQRQGTGNRILRAMASMDLYLSIVREHEATSSPHELAGRPHELAGRPHE